MTGAEKEINVASEYVMIIACATENLFQLITSTCKGPIHEDISRAYHASPQTVQLKADAPALTEHACENVITPDQPRATPYKTDPRGVYLYGTKSWENHTKDEKDEHKLLILLPTGDAKKQQERTKDRSRRAAGTHVAYKLPKHQHAAGPLTNNVHVCYSHIQLFPRGLA